MLRRTILVVLLAGIWMAALFSPFSAGARDETISAQARQRIVDNLHCSSIQNGRDAGRCLADKARNWQKLRKRFLDEQRSRIRQWKLDHVHLGLSQEFYEKQDELQRTIKQERKAYNRELKKLLRSLEKERQQIIRRPNTVSTIHSRRQRPTTRSKECFTGSRAEQRRCLRTTLYKNSSTLLRFRARNR